MASVLATRNSGRDVISLVIFISGRSTENTASLAWFVSSLETALNVIISLG